VKKPKKEAKKAIVLSREEQDFEKIRAIDLGLHLRAAEIVGDAMLATEIERGDETYPKEWLKTMDPERADRAFRTASAAWESQKEAPIFLKLAKDFLAGSMKVRSNENQGPKVLNATIVQVTAPLPVFPERIVKNDDE
jgi:hypothetical protein